MTRRNILAGLVASMLPMPKLPITRLPRVWKIVNLPPLLSPGIMDLNANIFAKIAEEVAKELDQEMIDSICQRRLAA